MMRLILVVAIIFFILVLCYQKSLVQLMVFRLKNKIRNNPSIGIKEQDNRYYYKEKGYTVSYKISESPGGLKTVEWVSLKRRLTSGEKTILNIKKVINNLFIYQRWIAIFRPSVVIILIISLAIFYLGMREHSLNRIGYFRWIVSRITGMNPESIGYSGRGWFEIYGQRRSKDLKAEPVIISFNPLGWFFSSDTANVNIWSNELKKYINYPVAVNDSGDIWLGKKGEQVHGRVLGDSVVWDEPQQVGFRERVSGHRIEVKDGQLRIFDK